MVRPLIRYLLQVFVLFSLNKKTLVAWGCFAFMYEYSDNYASFDVYNK